MVILQIGVMSYTKKIHNVDITQCNHMKELPQTYNEALLRKSKPTL